jgi:AraC-like DNA-binding protein
MAKKKNLMLIDASIIKPTLHWLESNGARGEVFLERAVIPLDLVETGGRVTKYQAYSFYADAAAHFDAHELGFAGHRPFQMSDLGTISESILRATTLKQALDIFCSLAGAAYEGNEFWLEESGPYTWLCNRVVKESHPGQVYGAHINLMVFVRMIQELTNSDFKPVAAKLESPRFDAIYASQELSGCMLQFNSSCTAIALPSTILPQTIVRDSKTPTRQNENREFSENHVPRFSHSLTVVIHDQIRSGHGIPDLSRIESILGMSRRTVRDRLAEEGTTYRTLRDGVMFEVATEMLGDPKQRVREIALDLDYSGANNFVRAFKRIAGVTPEVYRTQTLSQ